MPAENSYKLPPESRSHFGYYHTYHGESYSGIHFKHPMVPNGIFIVSEPIYVQKTKENPSFFQNLSQEEFEKIAVEIKDTSVIKAWERHEPGDYSRYETSRIFESYSGGLYNRKRVMLILGAGASLGSIDDIDNLPREKKTLLPPLGNELFHHKFESNYRPFKGAIDLIPKFKNLFNSDIENMFEQMWSKIRENYDEANLCRIINTQYYLRDLFEKISSHYIEELRANSLMNEFISKALPHGVLPTIVSFNYDTIFDHFFEEYEKIKFRKMSDYLPNGAHAKFQFFKLHGSWNWGWSYKKAIKETSMLDFKLWDNKVTLDEIINHYLEDGSYSIAGYGIESEISGSNHIFKVQINKDAMKVMEPGQFYHPAILVPFKNKDEFILPFHFQIIFKSSLQEVSEVIVFGWKGNEKLFNQLMEKNATSIQKITIIDKAPLDVQKNCISWMNQAGVETKHYTSLIAYLQDNQ